MAVFSALAELPKQQTTPPYSCRIWTISRAAKHTITRHQLHTADTTTGLFTALQHCKYRKANSYYSSMQQASPLQELTCHMASHSVTCHPAEVTFLPLPQQSYWLEVT